MAGRVDIMKDFEPTSGCVRRYWDVTERRTSVVTDPAQRAERYPVMYRYGWDSSVDE